MRRIAIGDWTAEAVRVCGRFGGIDAVLNGMRAHAHVPAVQEYGCVALDVLALNSANQERVAAAGGIEVFVYSFRRTTSLSANRLAAALALQSPVPVRSVGLPPRLYSYSGSPCGTAQQQHSSSTAL